MSLSHRHAPFFFLSPQQFSNGRLFLEGSDARHLAVVRRARPGDQIIAADGNGGVVQAELDTVGPGRVEAKILDRRQVARPAPRIAVAQAASRGAKLDFTIAKLVELGIDDVVVFESSRSVPRWDPAKKDALRRRWEKVAYESSKQSRRPWLASVAGPLTCEQAAGRTMGLTVVADPEAPEALRTILNREEQTEVTIVVGPEGGLSREDIEQFTSRGAVRARLGPGILRTETAGLVIAAAVMYHFGRLGG